jgi:hypothetical protein
MNLILDSTISFTGINSLSCHNCSESYYDDEVLGTNGGNRYLSKYIDKLS